MINKIAFFDRDGTINLDAGFTYDCKDLEFLDGVQGFMKRLIFEHYKIIIVTNQSGVAKGFFTLEESYKFTRHLIKKLEDNGIIIEDFFTCPHHVNGIVKKYSRECQCRKPQPGMLLRGLEKFRADPSECLVVGNKITDLQAGYAAGLNKGLLIGLDESPEFIKAYSKTMKELGFQLQHFASYPDNIVWEGI